MLQMNLYLLYMMELLQLSIFFSPQVSKQKGTVLLCLQAALLRILLNPIICTKHPKAPCRVITPNVPTEFVIVLGIIQIILVKLKDHFVFALLVEKHMKTLEIL